MGRNTYGQLGDGTTTSRSTPVEIESSGVSSVMNQSGFLLLNQAPTDLNSTSPLTILENQPIGTNMGDFNATDPDGDPITYSFASGAGDGNNTLFTLETNGTLKTATVFDYESNASTYSIRVQAMDDSNASVEGNFTITLLDGPNGTVTLNAHTGGSVTGAGSYDLNSDANLTATPNPGYLFSGWSGDLNSTDSNVTITVSRDFDINATFVQDSNDNDDDNLTNYQELDIHSSDPDNNDTDGDGLMDGYEVSTLSTNPTLVDSDSDGVGDYQETLDQTNPADSNSFLRLPFGRLGWWRFDEVNGTVAYDSSGNGRHGILQNMDPGSDYIEGKVNRAVELDGVNDFIEIPHDSALDERRTISLSLWIRLSQFPASVVPMIYKGGNTNTSGRSYSFWVYNDGHLHLTSSDGSQEVSNSAVGTVAGNQWFHLVGLIDRSSGSLKTYKNKILVANDTVRTTDTFSHSTSLRFGSAKIESAIYDHLNASLDEVMFYNRILSQDEIDYLYSSASTDADLDNLSLAEETNYGSSDDNNDTDGDGINDGTEVSVGLDPTVAHTDLMNLFIQREIDARQRGIDEGNASGQSLVTLNPGIFSLSTEAEKNASDATAYATGLAEGNQTGKNYILANNYSFG